jgi:hypothetical protein
MKTKVDALFIIEIIPIILILLTILYTKSIVQFSHSSLGKLIAVGLIVGYSMFDTLYGLVMCMMIILYYQLDYVENIGIQENMANILFEDGRFMTEGMTQSDTKDDIQQPDDNIRQFQQKYCRNNQLYYKESPIRNAEMAQHIFPDLVFKYEACNPCSKSCEVSYTNAKIDTEQSVVLPKSSNDYFYESWKDIFGKSFDFIPAEGLKTSVATISETFGKFM